MNQSLILNHQLIQIAKILSFEQWKIYWILLVYTWIFYCLVEKKKSVLLGLLYYAKTSSCLVFIKSNEASWEYVNYSSLQRYGCAGNEFLGVYKRFQGASHLALQITCDQNSHEIWNIVRL